jgi:hypothetical protein
MEVPVFQMRDLLLGKEMLKEALHWDRPDQVRNLHRRPTDFVINREHEGSVED